MKIDILTVIPFIATVSYCGLLLTVLRRDPFRAVNRAFALYLLSMLIWSASSFMMRARLFQSVFFWNRSMVIGALGTFVTFFDFTKAFLRMAGRKRWLYIGYGLYAILALVTARGYVVKDAYISEGELHYELGIAIPVVVVYTYFFVGFAAFDLVQTYRKTADSIHRNRIIYPLIGILAVILAGLLNFVPSIGKYPVDVTINILNAFLLAYAILRYQLLDISIIVRKGLLYSIPTAIIGAGYFFFISLAMRLFHALGGPQIFLLSLLVAAVTAVVAQPLRDKAQSWIDKRFFRERYDSSVMLQRLSRAVASVLDLRRLTGMILDEVTTTMHIERVAFFLGQEKSGEFRPMAQRGWIRALV